MGQEEFSDIIEHELKSSTETSEAIKEMFRDGIEHETSRRLIDQKADLTERQVCLLAVADFYSIKGYFDNLDIFTHSLKRHTVSLKRKGRGEAVQVSQGISERKTQTGFLGRMFGNNQV